MKVLSKMDSDVSYTLGEDKFLLKAKQECELDSKIKEHPVFKTHLANDSVIVLDNKGSGKSDETEAAKQEAYRQELLKQCAEKNIKVNPQTGIKKLEEKLGIKGE